MFFENPGEFLNASQRAVTVFGMSGVGKTHLSDLLRHNNWFHYSADYRIGTRYMGEFIVDNFKYEAMKVPFLRDLLISDSIHLSSNITFNNLKPLSTYLGTPGNPEKGGLPFAAYQHRQKQHQIAEVCALKDVPYFIERAKNLYGYSNFIADTGGSFIEVVNPNDPEDEVIKTLARHSLLLYIRGSEENAHDLVKRFTKAPKPMYYPPALLVEKWQAFKDLHGIKKDADIDPDAFAAWGFEALLYDRLPRYQTLADNFGYTVDAGDLAAIRDGKDFLDLMRKAMATRQHP